MSERLSLLPTVEATAATGGLPLPVKFWNGVGTSRSRSEMRYEIVPKPKMHDLACTQEFPSVQGADQIRTGVPDLSANPERTSPDSQLAGGVALSPSKTLPETPSASHVANGVAFLDEHDPGWRERIDADNLNIWSNTQCVLGQLYGSYSTNPFGLCGERAWRLGFTPYVAERASSFDLDEAWRQVL